MSHWIKANRRFAFLRVHESSFRKHINKKGTKLEEDLNKIDGDYNIGEYKEGKRHEHGWFAYIAIIQNNLITFISLRILNKFLLN